MKSLEKGPEPPILTSNKAAWTAAFVTAHATDPTARGKWGHAEIRAALARETRHLCAYCEAYVPDVSYEHVEHICPKSKFPGLAHEWDNLTSACERCNKNKGTYHEPGSEILNPYVDDPDDHLRFIGNLVIHVPGSMRGEITWRKLKLDRLDLANSRNVRLGSVREAYLRWHDADQPLKDALRDALRLDAAEGEFSAAVVAFLQAVDFPVD